MFLTHVSNISILTQILREISFFKSLSNSEKLASRLGIHYILTLVRSKPGIQDPVGLGVVPGCGSILSVPPVYTVFVIQDKAPIPPTDVMYDRRLLQTYRLAGKWIMG